MTKMIRNEGEKMFCYQCEQTAQGKGCTNFGACGKDPVTAELQDVLLHLTKGISMYAHRARLLGASNHAIDVFTVEALFSTITNVNFDAEKLQQLIKQAAELKILAKSLYKETCKQQGVKCEQLLGPAEFEPSPDLPELRAQSQNISILKRIHQLGPDAAGLVELITYSLKGMAAYTDHAYILGHENTDIYGFFHKMLDFLTHEKYTIDELLSAALECGKTNIDVMALLDEANTSTYGHPTPTQVRITPIKGKAILVSGHDLKDLEELLKQTLKTGINIYTHGEMLPAHSYPELKKYPHLAGNYGGAWQDQQKDFDAFPGSILMTTNCIQKPNESYKQRIFTTGLVAWPGVSYVNKNDFTPVIKAALNAPGFSENSPEQFITVGFGRNAVLSAAEKVIELIKEGKLRHIFLIGGCDGGKNGRNYYTELAQLVPQDCAIMTLACGKYRFHKSDFGTIDGIPRLLDIGQCNDAYSAIKIALALAEAFKTDVNNLPLSLVLSWYEQKAVCILLSLLYLGIKNIRIGPSLPAFLTPAAVKILNEKYNLMPITTAQEDLNAILS